MLDKRRTRTLIRQRRVSSPYLCVYLLHFLTESLQRRQFGLSIYTFIIQVVLSKVVKDLKYKTSDFTLVENYMSVHLRLSSLSVCSSNPYLAEGVQIHHLAGLCYPLVVEIKVLAQIATHEKCLSSPDGFR